jgi:hypothetical protein
MELVENGSLRGSKIADIDFDDAVRHHDLPDAGGITDYRQAFKDAKADLARMFARQKVLTIYRALVTDISELDTDRTGIAWAWEAEGALRGSDIGKTDTSGLLLEGRVATTQVNWHLTIAMNAFDPEEREIVLVRGASVTLISVHNAQGYRVGAEITPPALRGIIIRA